jgi:hypothetical protein
MSYVCDIVNAEDLVTVPGSAWVLASGYSAGGGRPPTADAFVAHGLNIRATGNSRSMLYVVGHGGRA